MSEPFLGEIRIVAFPFAPNGWAFCDGRTMAISQNTALFSLLGTTYGGDGRQSFGLPDFRGNASMHWGQGAGLSSYVPGEKSGVAGVTLTSNQLPAHTHTLNAGTLAPANAAQNVATPTSAAMVGLSGFGSAYSDAGGPLVAFSPNEIGIAGGSQPHANQQPYLTLNYIIALQGIYPSRS